MDFFQISLDIVDAALFYYEILQHNIYLIKLLVVCLNFTQNVLHMLCFLNS